LRVISRLVLVALSLVCATAGEAAHEHNERGLFAFRDKRFTDAVQEFEAVQKLDPAFPDIDLNLGMALFQAGAYQAALAPLTRARAAHPTLRPIHRGAARRPPNSPKVPPSNVRHAPNPHTPVPTPAKRRRI